MRKKSHFIKIFLVLLFCTAIIFSTSQFGAQAFVKSKIAENKYSAGTTIGEINFSGKSKNEASSMLIKGYTEWLNNTTFALKYGGNNVPFQLNQIHLNASRTIQMVKNGQENRVSIGLKPKQVADQIALLFPHVNVNDIDLKKLTTNLTEIATHLQKGTYTFDLVEDYSRVGITAKDITLSQAMVTVNRARLDLQAVLKQQSTIEIPTQSTFSLSEFVKKQKLDKLSPDALSIFATGIYKAILPTNFSIIERNIGSSVPSNNVVGFEAKFDPNQNFDLVFRNPNKSKYVLELQLVNKSLKVTLKGVKFPYDYKISTNDQQFFKPKTIVQYSPLIPQGQVKVKNNGENGQSIKVYRTVYQGDQQIKSELISEDYYPPVYRVEIHSLLATNSDQSAGTSQSGQQAETSSSEQTVGSLTTNSSTETSDSSLGQAIEVQK